MNIFESAHEFVTLDNRRFRNSNICTAVGLQNKFEVQLPADLIAGKTVLDLGSCLGAAGHWALSNHAKHYTGVELQDYYVDTSQQLLSNLYSLEKFSIVQDNIDTFLDNCITNSITYDYVLAGGILHGFFNTIELLKKISLVSNNTVVIDTINLRDTKPNSGFIFFKNTSMIRAGVDVQDSYNALSANINLSALDMVMSVNGYQRNEDKLVPKHHGGIDPYSDIVQLEDGSFGTWRYIVRYTKTSTKKPTLESVILNNDTTSTLSFNNIPTWTFDKSIAERFQNEALAHIPDYQRVIDLCVSVANQELNSADKIIDVGSALGNTIAAFDSAGFTNIIGVESSTDMIAKSKFADRVIHSDTFPNQTFKMVLINWTLHFIKNKTDYLTTVHNCLEDNGILILTDKTAQSDVVKNLYYQFKRNNGVDQAYIEYKEKQLAGYMHLESANWYMTYLPTLFSSVEILNSNLGFITFLCRK
jgi:cyclopropane fatty-acyl-phospholipid synthase-like methyltransferase